MAERAAPDDPAVTPELLRVTVEGGDRADYTQTEQDAADAAVERIDQALADGAAQIDSYLSPNYTLPLPAELVAASSLEQVNCDVARYNLYDDRAPEFVEERYDRRIKWLRDVSAGKASLGTEDTAATADGRVVRRTGHSCFDWGAY
jgi:phage gp36-like protein